MVTTIVSGIVALIGLCIAIYFAIKAGNTSTALLKIGQLFEVAAGVIDAVKDKSTGDARSLVSSILKDAGKDMDAKGIKDMMDSKLKELGLDEHK